MAQFTAQGRVKLLINGEGVPFWLETKDPFHYKLRSIQPNKRKLRFSAFTGIFKFSSHSSLFNKSTLYRVVAGPSVGGDGSISGEKFDYSEDDDDDDDDEFSRDNLACFRGLVLDISYRPINVVCWKRAICLEFMEKVGLAQFTYTYWMHGLSKCILADVLEYYDQTVNSPSGSFYIPAVLRVPHLLQVVKRRRIKSTLSRKNILYRDNYTCQYCSAGDNLTIDHVMPAALGGEWKWENLVTACSKCNSKKGQKTLEEASMKLIKVPKAPKDFDILAIPLTSAAIKMLKMRQGTPEEWRQYLASPSDS